MNPRLPILPFILSLFPACAWTQNAALKQATNPRSTVTAFLEACHDLNYADAAQYLDLQHIPERRRGAGGPQLAKQLEAILNSDSRFDVLKLSQSPEGNLADNADPSLEHIASISQGGNTFTIDLERVEVQKGVPVWLFSATTVALVPTLTPTDTEAAIEARLPRFLVSIHLLDTPVWKWIALLAVALIVLSLFRITVRLLVIIAKKLTARSKTSGHWIWIQSVLQPCLVIISAIVFVTAEQFIDPSALSRLYTARAILLVVVWSLAWCLINLTDLLLSRVDSLLEPRQRIVSHSLIYMGRRVANVAIFVIGAIVILDNWGYNMTTMIAGLGVGGIAIALAAQATIANVFGGVSVIGDHPVMVGDSGNFGGVLGTVEDIGMRSTRVRTLNRTLMSIPNAAFAGMNLENYALSDKILFNPTFQLKRGTPKDKIRGVMKTIEELLRSDTRIEVGPSPTRLATLTSASFGLEVFAYTLTDDIDEFYKIQADLFLEIDDAFTSMVLSWLRQPM